MTPNTHVDDIARLLSDDSACPHRVWFRSRYGSPWRAVEHGRGPAGENTGHTLVVHETAARLEQRGGDVCHSPRSLGQSSPHSLVHPGRD